MVVEVGMMFGVVAVFLLMMIIRDTVCTGGCVVVIDED